MRFGTPSATMFMTQYKKHAVLLAFVRDFRSASILFSFWGIFPKTTNCQNRLKTGINSKQAALFGVISGLLQKATCQTDETNGIVKNSEQV